MESHPQNPEFRNNPENFHSSIKGQFYNSMVIFLQFLCKIPWLKNMGPTA